MLREAAAAWREVESESGASLLDLVRVTSHGPGIAPDTDKVLRTLGARAWMMPVEEAQERWSGIRYDTRVLYTPEGARVNAEEAVATLQSETARRGGEVLLNTRVVSVRETATGSVEVATDHETYLVDTVVVTVGAWTEKLLARPLSRRTRTASRRPRSSVRPGLVRHASSSSTSIRSRAAARRWNMSSLVAPRTT
jgi:sarcosine oxidase